MLNSQEADTWRPGEPQPVFIPGGELTMRPSNMGIQSAARASTDLVLQTMGAPAASALTHARPSQRRRLDEEGDAVPGSQESALGVVPGSQDGDLAARAERQLSVAPRAPPVLAESQPVGRRRWRDNTPVQRWQGLQCCMCISGDPFHAHDSRGLMMHLVRAHLGQALSAEAVAQLRMLDKTACQICAGIRARTTPYCQHCRCATPTRPLVLGDRVPDRRRPAHEGPPSTDAAVGGAHTTENQEPHPMDEDGQAEPARALRHARSSEASKISASHLQRGGLKKVPKIIASRMATSWAETIEGSIAGDDEWAFLDRYRTRLLLSVVPQGVDRNTELKRRLQFWEEGRFEELRDHAGSKQK